MNKTRSIGRIIQLCRNGWGFIACKDVPFHRIFFHWTVLRQNTLRFPDLRIGMTVEFTLVEVPNKGWRALHVNVIPKEEVNGSAKENSVSTLQE